MSVPLLATKVSVPPPRPAIILRPRLIERLNDGLHRRLTLISAPAGFGKTTLVSQWLASGQQSAAWLSLDEGDNDTARFMSFLISALQAIVPGAGEGVLAVLQMPQPPPVEPILTGLLNEIAAVPNDFMLVLDDYHLIDAKPVISAIAFLLANLPSQMHLVIATREDPSLPLARLRAGGQLAELRASDLRFTQPEATSFLNQVMGLNLSPGDIADLEARTEGWIAGLQLAALALQGTISTQGHDEASSFIRSFTGSHYFVMDYLMEEVLQQQPERVQSFLLRTSILDRLCGTLCDALLVDLQTPGRPTGQETLETLERSNLFIVPLDHERRWYRYHHLFRDLLRQRLHQSFTSSKAGEPHGLDELHTRASQWFEENGFDLDAFHHAAAGHDFERAERLSYGKSIPLHFRGGAAPILDWLESLPKVLKAENPRLYWRYASLLLINGQTLGVEENLQAAEAAMAAAEMDDSTGDAEGRNRIGEIAAARATLALTRYDVSSMLFQSQRALEYLSPTSLSTRSTAFWVKGYADLLQGDLQAARQSLLKAIDLSKASGTIFTLILATIGLGDVQEAGCELYQAAETFRYVLQLAGDNPQQIIHEAHLGLARIHYEWNDLQSAEQHGRQALLLARQYERVIDRDIMCEVFLARMKLAQGDTDGAATILAQSSLTARQFNFIHRIPEIVSAQVLVYIRQGNLAAATRLAQAHNLPLSQARLYLEQGDPASALRLVEPYCQKVEARGMPDERLKSLVLLALVYNALGETDHALQSLSEALTLSERGGMIRTFLDEGTPVKQLVGKAATLGMLADYVAKLLEAFKTEELKTHALFTRSTSQPLVEPLSPREIEILQLVAQGLSNREISERLFLALDTVKGYNRKIFEKLQVQRRTEAVARARNLGLV